MAFFDQYPYIFYLAILVYIISTFLFFRLYLKILSGRGLVKKADGYEKRSITVIKGMIIFLIGLAATAITAAGFGTIVSKAIGNTLSMIIGFIILSPFIFLTVRMVGWIHTVFGRLNFIDWWIIRTFLEKNKEKPI